LKILRQAADSHPVTLPPGYNLQDASPQAISERTSYYRTRLEFLPYTQVIPSCCTASGCGPPRGFTYASPCSYVARPASGLIHATLISPYSGSLSLCLRNSSSLRQPRKINSLDRAAKSTRSPPHQFWQRHG
jgi:hypothetical protein